MNYYAHYRQQEYDPSSQNQQFYDKPTKGYCSYSYSNPQYTSIHPYSYRNPTVQPSQHEEQEPNPPGVTPPLPPEQGQNSYYQCHAQVAAGVLTMGPQSVVHQPVGIETLATGLGGIHRDFSASTVLSKVQRFLYMCSIHTALLVSGV